MSFVSDVVDAADPSCLALVAIAAGGARREVSFGEVADRSARLAGALVASGVGRGDVVMTVVGNRPEWVYAMLACWRIGAVALPCSEQLRPRDLRARMDQVEPRAVVADARDRDLVAEAGFDGPLLAVPDEWLFEAHTRTMALTVIKQPDKAAWTRLDPLGEALHFLRMSGIFYSRAEFSAPWGLEMPAMEECLMFHFVTSGRCWVRFSSPSTPWPASSCSSHRSSGSSRSPLRG